MNFILLGYTLAWIGLIYSTVVITTTFVAFTKLTPYQQETVEVTLGREFTLCIISFSYILIYLIS